jgi:hypothetical protein
MVTRLLNLCGLDLGAEQDLLGPDRGNPLGHFEHKEFKSLDESLLDHFGGSTDSPPDLEPNWEYESSLNAAIEKARLLLMTFRGKTAWGWKEPRTTLLIPFWRRLIPDAQFVICIRNPLEVARSIAQRDGMPVEKGLYLWNHYTRSAIQDTEGCPRIFTFYENYFTNGLSEIERVAKFCGLGLAPDSSGLQKAIYSELRHHSHTTAELLDCDRTPFKYKLLYIGVRGLASCGGFDPQSSDPASEISTNVAAFLRSLERFDEREQFSREQELMLKASVDIKELRSRLTRQEAQIQSLLLENNRLQKFTTAVRRTLVYRMYSKLIRPLKQR